MPELAEVEYYRKQWDGGLRQKIEGVHLNERKRVLRGVDAKLLRDTLTGATLLESKTHGKQMLFHFSKDGWLGVHLGMTGKLTSLDLVRTESSKEKKSQKSLMSSLTEVGKHDHLVLFLKERALVFNDPRQFGRILFHHGKEEPDWWKKLPPSVLSKEFTSERVEKFLQRRAKAPIKAVLLMQECFPGVGNWMADEILWRAKIHPKVSAGKITKEKSKALFEEIRFVCKEALRIIGKDFSDPPKSWLFGYRWKKGGNCPRCAASLQHATIGGRTTCWCPKCQGSVGK